MRQIVDPLARFIVIEHVFERRHLLSSIPNLLFNLLLVQALANRGQRRSTLRADAVDPMTVLAPVLLEKLRPRHTVGAGCSPRVRSRKPSEDQQHRPGQQHSAYNPAHLKPFQKTFATSPCFIYPVRSAEQDIAFPHRAWASDDGVISFAEFAGNISSSCVCQTTLSLASSGCLRKNSSA